MSSLVDTAGIPGGVPVLVQGDVIIVPDGNDAFRLFVGRRDTVRSIWLSAESVAKLPAAVAAVLGPPKGKRAPKPAAS